MAEPCTSGMLADVPPRRAGHAHGEQFTDQITDIPLAKREHLIKAELQRGNLPAFLRQLRPVAFGGGEQGPTIIVCVTPDYLAVGSDKDFLRIPMGLPTAMSVASQLGFVLPTRKIVDAIYEQAEVKLTPAPMPPTSEMVSTGYFGRHNRAIDAQRRKRGAPLGALVAGHKKDLVLTTRLARKPGRVAIYGWHRQNGRAIQPLSTVHGATYADYSHGVRLVSAIVSVDGQPRSIYEVLADPALAPLLSDEGPIPDLAGLVIAAGGTPASAGLIQLAAATTSEQQTR